MNDFSTVARKNIAESLLRNNNVDAIVRVDEVPNQSPAFTQLGSVAATPEGIRGEARKKVEGSGYDQCPPEGNLKRGLDFPSTFGAHLFHTREILAATWACNRGAQLARPHLP
jgi:hypothetical protein